MCGHFNTLLKAANYVLWPFASAMAQMFQSEAVAFLFELSNTLAYIFEIESPISELFVTPIVHHTTGIIALILLYVSPKIILMCLGMTQMLTWTMRIARLDGGRHWD